MRVDAVPLEEKRLEGVQSIDDYPSYHERHRIFPEIFNGKDHRRILDLSAGVGVVAKQIKDNYSGELLCNELSPTALDILNNMNIPTVSFDLDDQQKPYPLKDKEFDAVISLATIEHVIDIDHFMNETRRILADDGCLYISTPNYAGLIYLLPVLLKGRSYHDPLDAKDRYEFYAHVRYFTYRTLVEFVQSFGFVLETAYLPLPNKSSKYRALAEKSKLKGFLFKTILTMMYRMGSPRWASEPVLCFRKKECSSIKPFKKVVL